MKRYDFDTQEQRVLSRLVEEGIETEQSHQAYLETDEGQDHCRQIPLFDEALVDREVVDSIEYEETLKRIQTKLGEEG